VTQKEIDFCREFRRLICTFRQSSKGVVAVEFAILLPMMLLLYLYLIEFSRAFDEKRKVDRLSVTATDLISQQSTGKPITVATVQSILSAATALTTPYPANKLAITISVVQLQNRMDGSCCDAKIRWSFSQGGVLRPCNVVLQLVDASVPYAPTNLLASVVNSSVGSTTPPDLVVTDVSDAFQPLFKDLMTFFSSGFQRTTYFFARNYGQLLLQSPIMAQPNQRGQVC